MFDQTDITPGSKQTKSQGKQTSAVEVKPRYIYFTGSDESSSRVYHPQRQRSGGRVSATQSLDSNPIMDTKTWPLPKQASPNGSGPANDHRICFLPAWQRVISAARTSTSRPSGTTGRKARTDSSVFLVQRTRDYVIMRMLLHAVSPLDQSGFDHASWH